MSYQFVMFKSYMFKSYMFLFFISDSDIKNLINAQFFRKS